MSASPQKLAATATAKAKRGCNSTWSTSHETRPASFERGDRGLSNDAGLVSRDVDHVELQPRFALALTAAVNFCGEISQIDKISQIVSAPTIAVNTREAISQMVRISIVLIFRVPYFSGSDAAERGNFLWGGKLFNF